MKSAYSQRQALFAQKLGEFLTWLFANGFEVTLGGAYDKEGEGGHKPNSVHSDRMAIDLNIYLAGLWMDGNGDWQAPHWQKIGAQWKSNGDIFKWGGDFKIKDFNHFSVTPDGVRA